MQARHDDGTFGKVMEFTPENLEYTLRQAKVNHIDVFPGTKENIENRQALEGKKIKLGVKKRFQKAKSHPRLNLKLNIEIPKHNR